MTGCTIVDFDFTKVRAVRAAESPSSAYAVPVIVTPSSPVMPATVFWASWQKLKNTVGRRDSFAPMPCARTTAVPPRATASARTATVSRRRPESPGPRTE